MSVDLNARILWSTTVFWLAVGAGAAMGKIPLVNSPGRRILVVATAGWIVYVTVKASRVSITTVG
jgi:hypothetical protein